MLQQCSHPSCRWLRAAVAVLVTAGVIGVIPWRVTAAEAGARSKSALHGVQELGKPVTYTETKIPLGELVAKVADETGVRLTASPEVADEPVAVVVRDLPARELLDRVAELLEYRWSRRMSLRGWRYEVWQDLAGKQREEALRQAAFAAVEQRFREEVARHAAMAALPLAEIQRMKQAGDRYLEDWKKLAPEARVTLIDRPGERERRERYALAARLSSPVTRGMAQTIGRLTPRQWLLLRGGESLTFSSDPQPGELQIPAELARAFRAARPSMASGMRSGNAEFTERERQRETEEEGRWAAATGYRVTLQMNPSWFGAVNALSIAARAQPERSGAPPELSHFQGGEGTRLLISASAAGAHGSGPQDTTARDPRIARDPVFGAKKRFQPEPQVPPNHLGVRPRFARHRMLRDLLPELARTYGVQIVADSYRSTRRVSTGLPSQPTALHALLDRLSMDAYRWERQGNVALLRSRTWFLERPREIPLRIVRQWKRICDRYGLLSMDEWLEAASALTDVQLERGNLSDVTMEAALPVDFLPVLASGSAGTALRLYASLTPPQRQALWQGGTIPVAQMTLRQRALLLEFARDSLRDRQKPWNPARLAGSSLSMTRRDYLRTLRPYAHGVRATTEPLAASATSGTQSSPAPRLKSRVTSKDGTTRYSMSVLSLRLQAGPEILARAQFNVRTP